MLITVCQFVQKGTVAVFGIDLALQGDYVASILNYHGIPFIQSNPTVLWSTSKTKYGTSINLFPSRIMLMKVRCIAGVFYCKNHWLSFSHFSDAARRNKRVETAKIYSLVSR